MTPDKALKLVLQGRRVRHVETGCIWERYPDKRYCVCSGGIAGERFPAYGTFKLLKERPAPWKPGEVRWQRNGDAVFRYTSMDNGRMFVPSDNTNITHPWSDRVNGYVIDITPEEGLRLIHAMGWNEDGTKYEPAPTLDESLYEPLGTIPVAGDMICCPTSSYDRDRAPRRCTGFLGEVASCAGSDYWAHIGQFEGSRPPVARVLKRPPTPTLDDLRKLVGKDPRVGDVVMQSGYTRTVKAVTPELVAYHAPMGYNATPRVAWAEMCKTVTKIERAK